MATVVSISAYTSRYSHSLKSDQITLVRWEHIFAHKKSQT